jgi:hypothetical protein
MEEQDYSSITLEEAIKEIKDLREKLNLISRSSIGYVDFPINGYEFEAEDYNVTWNEETRRWEVRFKVDLWEEFRKERNRRLQESDWTQCLDVRMINDSEWKEYRENLRNLPQITTNPKKPNWPIQPKVITL